MNRRKPDDLPRGLALCFTIILSAGATAAPSPCAPEMSEPWLLLGADRGQATELRRAGRAESRLTHSRIDWRGDFGGLPVGLGHTYSIHDISPLPRPPSTVLREPSTNGHLHVLHAEVSLAPLLAPDWDLRLQPALAVSSNFLKSPDEIGRDALQLNVGASRRLGGAWRAGLCADHRFGDWRVYPTLAWHWKGGPWALRLGWPDSSLARSAGEDVMLSLDLAPAGNRWRVLDERVGDSRFVHEAWRLRGRIDWRPLRRWSLGFYLDSLFEREYSFLLDNGQHHAGEAGSALQFGLELRWHYRE